MVASGELTMSEWMKAREAQHEAIQAAKLVPIGLSRDGKDYVFAHSSECADCLKSLKAEGYHVPQYAIDELLEEAAEAPEVRK
jgi:hypothetical protein